MATLKTQNQKPLENEIFSSSNFDPGKYLTLDKMLGFVLAINRTNFPKGWGKCSLHSLTFWNSSGESLAIFIMLSSNSCITFCCETNRVQYQHGYEPKSTRCFQEKWVIYISNALFKHLYHCWFWYILVFMPKESCQHEVLILNKEACCFPRGKC